MSRSSCGGPFRVITASSVTLPRIPWYKKISIPGLVTRYPSPRSNIIRTTKYTIFNFVIKNLWEQFHRLANIYFLFIILLNYIPQVGAVGTEVAFMPLAFVLLATAVKDVFEDYRRFKSDKVVNHRLCRVYDKKSRSFVSKHWSKVCVGDFVQLLSDDVIPADLLFLHSSDPLSICYIETANIDGETNLKQRYVAPGSGRHNAGEKEDEELGSEFCLADFTGTLYCEEPHNKIYDFNGYIETSEGTCSGVNRSNLLLRGCVLRNTTMVVGLVVYAGHQTKSMLNNSGPQTKRSKLERAINIEIISQVTILFILCFIGVIANGVWTSRHLDTNAPFFPYTSVDVNVYLQGFIQFWTFLIVFQVIIPVSLYVTIEIVKLVQVYFMNWDLDMYYAVNDFPFQCRALNINEDLGQIQYVFSDKTGTLTENKMVFRCCSIGGMDYPHTLAEDLLKVHSSIRRRGQVENDCEGAVSEEQEGDFSIMDRKTVLDPELVAKLTDPIVKDFFTVLAICNTVMVSSRGHHSSRAGDPPPQVDSCNAEMVARLNQIKYEAESPDEAALVKAAYDYGYVLLSRSLHHCSLLTPAGEEVEYDILHTLEFDPIRKCMSIVVREKGQPNIILYSKGADSVIYRHLRTDLLEDGCLQESGFDVLGASHPIRGNCQPNGGSGLLNTPLNLDGGGGGGGQDGNENGGVGRRAKDNTRRHLNCYAKLGLRTLCMAKRVLTEAEYAQWLEGRHEAEVTLQDRSNLLFQSCCSIESQLQLLGASGVEDKLQKGVPEAIASLLEAGLKVWVLTGDKQETAINIGYSSRLIDPSMEVVLLNAHSLEDSQEELVKIQCRLDNHEEVYSVDSVLSDSLFPDSVHFRLLQKKVCCKRSDADGDGCSPVALVVDGPTLQHVLSPTLKPMFQKITRKCRAVMCCRTTPLQKAEVVEMVRFGLKQMTLAIGDGANDVSMIQKADVGVGIAGREGMQAVMASDFAMGRFRFLVKLLLVHGHWSYDRLSRLVLYFFYKNVAFATLLFWFQIFNGFSGSNAIDSFNLIIFNLVYTSLPILQLGVMDQDLPAEVLMREKGFYKQGACSQVYTRPRFWLNIADAFYQSGVVFFVALGAYYFGSVGLVEFGFLLNTSIVIVVNLHLCLETLHWTLLNYIFVGGSILFTFVFNYIYCAIDTKQTIMDTLFVMQNASLRAEFWFVLLVTPVIALLPRLLGKIVIQEVWPSPVMAARAREQARPKKGGVANKAGRNVSQLGYHQPERTNCESEKE